jgi:hypothetical protein
MTPTIEGYVQILNFSNEPHKVYFRQRIENTIAEVIKIPRIFRTQIIIFFSIKNFNSYKNNNIIKEIIISLI